MIRELRVRVLESAEPSAESAVSIIIEDMNDSDLPILNVGAQAKSPLWKSDEFARAVLVALYSGKSV